jgi:Tfp pilus assembly protein PilW
VNEGTDQDSLLKKYRQEIATLRAQLAQAHAQAAEGVSPVKQAFSRAAAAAAASARRVSSSGDDIDVDSEEQVSLLMITTTAVVYHDVISSCYDAQDLLLLVHAACSV